MKDCLIQILDRVLIFLHALLSHSDIKKVLSATKLQGRNEQLTHLLIYKNHCLRETGNSFVASWKIWFLFPRGNWTFDLNVIKFELYLLGDRQLLSLFILCTAARIMRKIQGHSCFFLFEFEIILFSFTIFYDGKWLIINTDIYI